MEEMTSLFKIYKSNQIQVGEGRRIEVKTSIVRKPEPSESDLESEEIAMNIEDQQAAIDEMVEQAEDERETMLKKAREESEQIILEAQERSNQIIEESKDKGYKQGYDNGFEKGQQHGYEEMKKLVDEAALLKHQVFEEQNAMLKDLEEELVNLVIKTVRRVIQAELQENQELTFNLIEEGLKECNYTESLIIHISDIDYDLIYAYKNRIYLMADGIRDIEIRSDPSVGPGSVVIETVSGQVDASVETQIKKIESVFLDLLKSEE